MEDAYRQIALRLRGLRDTLDLTRPAWNNESAYSALHRIKALPIP